MDQNQIDITLGRVRAFIEQQRLEDGVQMLLELRPADQAEVFNQLDDGEQALLLPHLDIRSTAALFEEMEDQQVLDAAEDMDASRLADVLDQMDPDDAADLLGDLPPEQASEALAQMEEAADVLPLLGYPDETAGGLMTTSYIALRRQNTAGQAIDFLRKHSLDTDIPYYIYVIDREKHLTGVVGLRELVITSPDTLIENIMDRDVIFANVGMDQEEVARIMGKYGLAALPVVNIQQHLVGVITYDDIAEVIQEEVTEDFLHLGGIESGPVSDKPYWDQRVVDIVRSRFFWLLILFVAETFTGTVLRHYESEIETVVALSFFVPLLIGTGGNAGSQTVATVIRALALREVRPRDAIQVWFREVKTALLLGLLIGLVALGRSMLWGVDYHLAMTVGITVTTIVIWANTVASVVPLFASAVGIDPTIVSGPLMTTLIDGTGLVIYFSLAAWILPQL